MNKKVLISLLLIAVMAFGAGLGTFAYYSKTFESKDNEIAAATFNVSSNGNLIGVKDFDIKKFAPGFDGFWDFFIDKTNSDVRVGSYNIKVDTACFANQANGDYLFRTGTPIKFDLYRWNLSDDKWYPAVYDIEMGKDYNLLANDGTYKTDWFRIMYKWPWETDGVNDNEFKGDSGKVNVAVTAIQGKDNEHVKFANFYVTDYTDNITSTSTVRILVDNDGVIIGVEGYDNYLGNLVYVNNPKTLNELPVRNDGKVDVNGNYSFSTGANRFIEIKPIMN